MFSPSTNWSAFPLQNSCADSNTGGWHRVTESIPEDIDRQVELTFRNIQDALELAGSKGWEQVFQLRVYLLGGDEEIIEAVLKNLRKNCPSHAPLMTVVGVTFLYSTMKLQIEAEAYVGK